MRLTVLMYHQVAEPPAGAVHTGNWVTPAQFEAQIAFLRDAGYRSITLDDWVAHRRRPRALPRRPLVVTFDDGYQSVREHAWPLLQRYGFGATTFLVVSGIGGTNRWDADEIPQPLLGESDVRELARDGMRFGSHGWSHRRLRRCSGAELHDELVRSRDGLAALLGAPVTAVSYPYSSADARVRAAARAAGYAAGVTGRGRINPRRIDPLGLRRVKPDVRTSLDAFRRKLLWERLVRW